MYYQGSEDLRGQYPLVKGNTKRENSNSSLYFPSSHWLCLPGDQEAEKLSRIQQSSKTSVDEENKKLKRRAHQGEEPSKHF